MKNLTRIFFAIAALVAVSCTTDATEDLAANFEGGGKTTITLSLESSRTQLGEAVNGLYPVAWSANDAISVNGIKSTSIAIDSNASVASFSFSGVLNYPYAVAYPAAGEGKVLFADQQSYTEGTFTNGAATMYGYAEAEGSLSLKHLTGVLKIGVTGSKTLSYAQISTVDRAAIAGEFALDFASGEIEATATSKGVINYSFGEGVQLSSTPTYLHVAVPAGKYEELYVTLYDNEGGVMYATVKANDEKPLAAGAVREFSNNIAYKANASVFVIKDKESLKAFAAEAATSEKNALFVADVDMTGETWTPIEGYTGTILGNGYAIKGMTAPLFGTTSASIKGLHLTEVNIYETVNPNVAPFARYLQATDTLAPMVEHCSASGKITVDCQEYVYQSFSSYSEFAVAGVVGFLRGGGVSNCVSRVDIDIKQFVAKSNTSSISPAVGGVVGGANYWTRTDKSIAYSPLSYCVNYGNITVANGSDNGTTGYISMHLGGCLGVQFNKNWTTLTELTNYGDITIDADFNSTTLDVAGVIGYCYTTTATKLYNHGNITWNSGLLYGLRIGGVCGYIPDSGIASHLYNEGDILFKEGVKITGSLYLGGIVGYHKGDANGVLAECVNDGDITIDADMANDSVDAYFRIGGVMSWSQCKGDNLTNNGDINISSRLFNKESESHRLCIAGIVGYNTVVGCTNTKNTGDITFTGKVDTADDATIAEVRLNIGGIHGYSTYGGSNAYNEGNITVDGCTFAGQLRVGGLFGHSTGKLTTGGNSGNVTIKGTTTVNDLIQFAGIAGYLAGGTGISNSGNVTIESSVTVKGTAAVAGGVGYNNSNALDGFVNTGAVNIQGTYADRLSAAGCVAAPAKPVLNNTNKGAVTVNATMNGGAGIGGVIGYLQTDKAGVNKYLTNEAPISVSGTTGANSWIGGVIGNINMSNGQTDFVNKETGVITVDIHTATNTNTSIGGVAGLIQDSSTSTYNYAPMNISGWYSLLYVGGAVAAGNNYDRTDAKNYGDITISVETGGGMWAGGLCAGGEYGKTWSSSANYGDITVTADSKIGKGCYVGGIYGKCDSSVDYLVFDGCSNEGNIIVSGTSGIDTTSAWDLRIGGLAGDIRPVNPSNADYTTITNGFVNKGTITYNGSHTGSAMIGGVTGELTYWDAAKWTGELVNEGDITCTGTATLDSYVGGVVGSTTVPFANGVAYCTINAQGYKGVGMVTGTSRSETTTATNCKVGGTITGEYNIEDEEYKIITLDASNYFKYIYGSGESTDWAGTENYDGCTLLEAKPSTITPAE